MTKEILPNRLIFDIENGTMKSAALHYKIKTDGVLDNRKTYTMTVSAAVSENSVNDLINDCKRHAENGEGI